MHAAMITAMLFNMNRGKGTKPRQFQDFMFVDQEVVKRNDTLKFAVALKALAKPKKKVK